VDHPAHLSSQRPWRTTALVAAALAAFEAILLVLFVLALLVRPLLGSDATPASAPPVEAPAKATPAKASPTAPAKAAAAPTLERTETLVIVLNGNGSPGAAGERADLVRTKGYLIAGTANAPRTDFERSVVMFRPGHRPEALRLARDFGVKRVSPLDGIRPTELQGAHVALIVGQE
jgi:hypothetical protein